MKTTLKCSSSFLSNLLFLTLLKKNPPWGPVSYVISLTFSLITWQTLFLVKSVISRKEQRQKRRWWGPAQGSTAPTLRLRQLLQKNEGSELECCSLCWKVLLCALFPPLKQCKPSPQNNTDVGLHLSSTAVCSFWSFLVIKKLMKMRQLRVRVDRTLKDQFHSGFCRVGKEN